jgi:hypothetical protein
MTKVAAHVKEVQMCSAFSTHEEKKYWMYNPDGKVIRGYRKTQISWRIILKRILDKQCGMLWTVMNLLVPQSVEKFFRSSVIGGFPRTTHIRGVSWLVVDSEGVVTQRLSVRKRNIPTERYPLASEVDTNFCGYRVSRVQRNGSPRPLI